MNNSKKTFIVTGALSFSGRYISEALIQKYGQENIIIKNLTNLQNQRINNISIKYPRLEFENQNYDFNDQNKIIHYFQNAEALFLSYWVRFDDFKISRQQVIKNAQFLIDSAKQANVNKLVYISHTKTSLDSNIPYIQGKAQVEQHLRQTYQKNYGIVKPCTIYGDDTNESIIINNLAYLLRTFPVFPIPGDGNYALHPVHVRDLANLCIDIGTKQGDFEGQEVDAVSEKFTFIQLLQTIKENGVPKNIAVILTKPLNLIFNDILIDRQDLDLMMNNITSTDGEVTGKLNLTDWIRQNKNIIGQKYISSIHRYYND